MKKILLTTVLALATSISTSAQAMKPDAEGFIQDWLIIAPIENSDSGADALDKQQVANEGMLAPKAGDKTKSGSTEMTWKKVKAKEHFFDVNEVIGQQTDTGIAYAVCYVTVEEEMKDLKLKMGSNDQGKVYLNGKELTRFDGTRTLEKDTEEATGVTLKKGSNTIVFKVINESNNWQGCLRFVDKNDKPVTKMTISLTPAATAKTESK